MCVCVCVCVHLCVCRPTLHHTPTRWLVACRMGVLSLFWIGMLFDVGKICVALVVDIDAVCCEKVCIICVVRVEVICHMWC